MNSIITTTRQVNQHYRKNHKNDMKRTYDEILNDDADMIGNNTSTDNINNSDDINSNNFDNQELILVNKDDVNDIIIDTIIPTDMHEASNHNHLVNIEGNLVNNDNDLVNIEGNLVNNDNDLANEECNLVKNKKLKLANVEPKYLVGKMRYGDQTNLFELSDQIPDQEVKFQLLMTKFTTMLARKQQKLFGNIMTNIMDIYFGNKEIVAIQLPNNYSDLRRMYIDGKESINANIKIPECRMLQKHSYVSIVDCIEDFLTRNEVSLVTIDDWETVLIDNNKVDNMFIFNSERTNEILENGRRRELLELNHSIDENKCLPLFLKFWSDDFDPNRSVKQNRQSVWIRTCTIFGMTKNATKLEKTYPISLSKKGHNHEEIDIRTLDELEQLRSGKFITIFSNCNDELVNIHADIYCVLNDQPERRGNLGLAHGNSIVHGRFGCIIDSRKVASVIRSCKKCTKSIIDEMTSDRVTYHDWRDKSCKHCSAWMYNMEHDKLWYEPDNDYPIHDMDATIKIKDGKIGPRIITGDDIIKGINYCCSKLLNGGYNAKEARMYLKQLGLHTVAQEKIISTALQSMQNKDYDHEQMVSYKLPASWYGFEDTTIFVDVPMHLLMLGVVKSVMGKINKWLRKINKNTMFVNKVSGILLQIKKMNIEWCKVLEYPTTDKTGGWVSEFFLGMSRIGRWFYGMLNYLDLNEEQQEELNDILKLVESMCTMVKEVMWKEYDPMFYEYKLEAVIRYFLIYYDKIDVILGEEGVPGWIKQYNMMCLLNLPNVIKRFGSLRNIWEGGNDGEAILKRVKNQMKSGLVNEWEIWVINNLIKDEVYSNWESSINKQEIKNNYIRMECKTYVSRNIIKKHIEKRLPLSGIINNNKLYMCYRKDNEIKLYELLLADVNNKKGEGTNKKIINYFDSNNTLDEIDEGKLSIGYLLLPRLTEQGYRGDDDNDCMYEMVRSDWK
jgi:hypothetical protein